MGTTALSDSELRVMDIVWGDGGESTARRIGEVLAERFGYSLSATYTLITRCIKKGALERIDPGYRCRALVSQQAVQDEETDGLIDRLFGGSADRLFAALVDRKKVSSAEIDRLRRMADGLEDQPRG